MKKIFLLMIVFMTGCNLTNSYSGYSNSNNISTEMKQDTISIEDSLNLIFKERQNIEIPKKIFGGIELGCTQKKYDIHITNFKNEFSNNLYINHGSTTEVIHIDFIEPKFYNDRLYELHLYIENSISDLIELYKKKYGYPKSRLCSYQWLYKNIKIDIDLRGRQSMQTSLYNKNHISYYKGYGNNKSSLTKNSTYWEISYYDLSQIEEINQQELLNKKIKDSLIKEEKEKEASKLLQMAKKQVNYI
ncbi:MAG: hypothetical protein IAC23_00570 [Bacteroidetes bacterium]|uniref:Lipoprotein n=1 Tax=Candidatus Cryptobacteroides merdavium TaxID=2840769 RepID=A0A9D9HAP9_9BACT|nr:hypothetical protein [Candidatus Cryptobacteroides merdavium]